MTNLKTQNSIQRDRRESRIIDQIYQPISEDLDQVTKNLINLIESDNQLISELLSHVLENQGKRIRPAITLLSSKFHPNDGNEVLGMATGVEALHIGTLIHDDTVDKSDLRRGKDTVISRWGLGQAILLGDYLLAKATTFVYTTSNIRVIRRFSDLSVELSSGELFELQGAFKTTHTREEYLERIYLKTASLFSACTEGGAILSGASEKTVKLLKDYGYNLGMAFQIVDDILDLDGNMIEVGKPVGHDLGHGIMTLPSIIYAENANDTDPINQLFQDPPKVDQDKLNETIQSIQNSSAIDESFGYAKLYCQKALDILDELDNNKYSRSLKELTSHLIERRS